MTGADNLHSRIVGWLKIVLPLSALGLLSILFVFASDGDDDSMIPFAQIADIAQDQRISAPRFSGVTEDGAIIAIAADSARPDPGDPAQLSIAAPRLTLDTAEGNRLSVTAGAGAVDNSAQEARLTGLARLQTSSGYVMETTGILADLRSGTVTSLGPLEIQAPYGTLTAGAVTFSAGEGEGSYRMDFAQGVKLVYQPPDPGQPATEGP